MEIALAIAGLLLTFLLSDPIIRFSTRCMVQMRRRRWSADQHRKGNIQNRRHFGFEAWSVRIRIDARGSAEQLFSTRIVNLSNELVEFFYLPVFVDAPNIAAEAIKPWAKSGRRTLPVSFVSWDAKRSQGRIRIDHVPPLAPGERRSFSWGIHLPHVFAGGDDYYVWDVEVPYYEMYGTLEFAPIWKIIYADWDEVSGHIDPPSIRENTVRWHVLLPPPGTRLRLKMGLAKVRK